MRKIQHIIVISVLTSIILGGMLPGQAIPVFARKYGFDCNMCHSNFPRLNDFGVRYRQNGYQLPGKESEERTVLESPPPVAFRTSVGYNDEKFTNEPGASNVKQFQLNGLDVLSGGLFKENIGYLMVAVPEINGSRGVAPQSGTVEMANVIFSNVGGSWLNKRLGRFEGAYTAFSAKRQLTVSPYEVYNFSFPGGITFADTQTGLEISGYGRREGLKYAVGLVNGSETNNSNDAPNDAYARVEKVFGRGEGQTAGQRLGLTGYFGKARPLGGGAQTSFTRLGADASLNFSQLNLELQWLHSRDKGALWDSASSVSYDGGFAQANYRVNSDLITFARYDWVSVPTAATAGDIRRWTIGGRYYFEDNLALHLEYSDRKQDSTTIGVGNATDRLMTARLDFAF